MKVLIQFFAVIYFGFSILPATQAAAVCTMPTVATCCSSSDASCCTPAAASDCCSFESPAPSLPKIHFSPDLFKIPTLFAVLVAQPAFQLSLAKPAKNTNFSNINRAPPDKIYLRIGKLLLFDSEEDSSIS